MLRWQPRGKEQTGDYGTEGWVETEHLRCCRTDQHVREHRHHKRRSLLGALEPALNDPRQHKHHHHQQRGADR